MLNQLFSFSGDIRVTAPLFFFFSRGFCVTAPASARELTSCTRENHSQRRGPPRRIQVPATTRVLLPKPPSCFYHRSTAEYTVQYCNGRFVGKARKNRENANAPAGVTGLVVGWWDSEMKMKMKGGGGEGGGAERMLLLFVGGSLVAIAAPR